MYRFPCPDLFRQAYAMSSADLKGTPRQAFENALALLRDGGAGLAREHLLAILETDPAEVNALRLLDAALELARVYERTGRGSEAEAVLAAFCRREPRASVTWQRYADVLFDHGKAEEARRA